MVNKEILIVPIYEDEQTLAFLDINPASSKGGHTLVISKTHYGNLIDMSEEDLEAVSRTIKKVSRALLKIYPGLNIMQNNGKEAGQYVMHVHFHLIPRYEGDGITIEKWVPQKYAEGQMEEVLEKIKSFL